MLNKVDFKPILVRKDKEGNFILIKGATQQEEITIVKLYVPNIGTSSFIKHTLLDLKTQIDCSTVVVGDFNTLLSPKDRSSRKKKKNKEILKLNDTIDLMDIFRLCHPSKEQYTFFSAAHRTFSKIDHI
jgi:exonuclease III